MKTLAILVALQLALLGLYVAADRLRTPAPLGGELRFDRVDGPVAPPVELSRVDGARLTLAGPALLHFWSTTCPPCRAELPELIRFARAQPRLELVAVAVGDDAREVQEFFAGEVPPEVVFDPSGRLVAEFGVGPLPDTYLLDGRGRARARVGGARPWGSPAAPGVVARLLAGE